MKILWIFLLISFNVIAQTQQDNQNTQSRFNMNLDVNRIIEQHQRQQYDQLDTVRSLVPYPESAKFKHIRNYKQNSCGYINARNEKGVYTGWKPWIIINGKPEMLDDYINACDIARSSVVRYTTHNNFTEKNPIRNPEDYIDKHIEYVKAKQIDSVCVDSIKDVVSLLTIYNKQHDIYNAVSSINEVNSVTLSTSTGYLQISKCPKHVKLKVIEEVNEWRKDRKELVNKRNLLYDSSTNTQQTENIINNSGLYNKTPTTTTFGKNSDSNGNSVSCKTKIKSSEPNKKPKNKSNGIPSNKPKKPQENQPDNCV